MTRYPKYKESGVRWIGEVPAEWSVRKLKHGDLVEMGQSPSSDDYNEDRKGYPFLQGNADFTSVYPVPRIWCETANKVAEAGDVLLSVRAPVGAVNIADRTYGIGRGLCAVRGQGSNPRYLYYVLRMLEEELNSISTGSTYTAVSVDDVRNVYIPQPSLAEQGIIAGYLDQKTGEIDTLICNKQALITLLRERRAALINRAVTKGLDPNVTMKDSGTDWLGEVPKHWEVVPMRRVLVKLEQGWSPSAEDRPAKAREWGVIKLSAISEGIFHPHEHKALPATLEPRHELEISRGDLLLTRANTPQLVGSVCFVQETLPRLMLSDLVYRIRLEEQRADARFFGYWLQSQAGRFQIERDARGSSQSMVKISQQHIRAWLAPLPPIDEQREISEHLTKQSAKLEELIRKERSLIEKLHELRASLISEVVTGKRRVTFPKPQAEEVLA